MNEKDPYAPNFSIAQTPQQMAVSGVNNTPISSQSLQPQQPIQPVIPTPPQPPLGVTDTLQSQIDAINKQYEVTQQEQEIGAERTRIQDLTAQLYGNQGERATRARLESDPNILSERQRVQDLTSQANALIAEAKAIPLQLEQDAVGKGITSRVLSAQQQGALRQNAIKALSVGSLLSASQGNLTLALEQVDRAINAEFEPRRAELEARKQNLEMMMNDPAISKENARRGEIARARLADEERRLQKEEEIKRVVSDLSVQAASMGADSLTLSAIRSAQSKEEAQQIMVEAGLFAPKIETDNQIVKLDNGETVIIDRNTGKVVNRLGGGKPVSGAPVAGSSVITTTDGKTVSISPDAKNWVDLINNGSMSLDEALSKIGSTASTAKLKNEIIAGINAQGGQTETKLAQMKNTVQSIDDILSGDFEYFGASLAPREGFLSKLVGGNPYYEAFKAKVDNLVSSLTIDNLGLLKGPMSDKDIEFIKSLSSGINIKMSETEAKKRLEQIKSRMQEKIVGATGAKAFSSGDINSLRSKYNY